ncbi:hypothetical protein JEY40_27375 [Bradyrhizobium japonicum]|uniref:Uncharacterized protein n=1 Tax=Bradyrhizobium japonicum TaxID=375 RepID=A0A0A3XMT7_BRAJP|nr:hypothetical protein [Bradyrhizobium japonicum]KGT75695.1 hypothetical protein MA20_31260 [Bradyrhizobium japonicum]MCS3895179.1 hypothetical protein [Bradyrhizobium japonicum USDA 38]MCS3947694.1 hypothetical protein [Bradyrhizobium japonicum]MCW2219476.1 hypothetical protein [Bradyrhizobium japonicum]MCW2344090.1 hypothetical protein [Bradyrhizobium japonicum]
MKRLTICGLIAVASLVAATTVLQSHKWPIIGTVGAARIAGMPESQSGGQADKLPVQDFDDRSLVFPRETKPEQ